MIATAWTRKSRRVNVLEVQSVSGPPVSVTVPIMTAVVDRFARMITGVGPANAAMGLYYYPGVNETVHTNADGTFATTFRITAASIGSGEVVLTYLEPRGTGSGQYRAAGRAACQPGNPLGFGLTVTMHMVVTWLTLSPVVPAPARDSGTAHAAPRRHGRRNWSGHVRPVW